MTDEGAKALAAAIEKLADVLGKGIVVNLTTYQVAVSPPVPAQTIVPFNTCANPAAACEPPSVPMCQTMRFGG